MTRPPFEAILADASLAPSVHNVQPVRWQVADDGLNLLRDTSIKLPHADPSDKDILLSVGAVLEGVALAASRFGFGVNFHPEPKGSAGARYQRLGRVEFLTGGQLDPLAEHVAHRCSWRGAFGVPHEGDRQGVGMLTRHGGVAIASGHSIKRIAALADEASLRFMSNDDFRNELTSWMRLSRRDPRWSLDGLNAEAMQMNKAEAFGASVLLGWPFALLSKLGMASALTSEASRNEKALGFLIVHRPIGEDPIEQGRHFYRHWLDIERAGFVAQVVAALADDDQTRMQLHDMIGLPENRRILTVFVFGRLPERAKHPVRARLPMNEILLPPPNKP